jgi:hypothetical protein
MLTFVFDSVRGLAVETVSENRSDEPG